MPARPQHSRGSVQNFGLPRRAHFNDLLTPIRDGGFLLAEHSFPGAGRIDQNAVKKRRKAQASRMLVQNECVANAHALKV